MKIRILSALAGLLFLSACDSDEALAPSVYGETARLSLSASPVAPKSAARAVLAARAEVGGKLVVTVTNPSLLINRADTSLWDGTDTLRTAFEGLMPGAGYRLVAQYLDARGLVTHRDSVGPFALGRAQDLPLSLKLGAVAGKILLQFPVIPDGVDSLGLTVEQGGSRWSTRIGRPSTGRGSLRLDSLPLGSALRAHLRAWTATGDTLYFLDTSLALNSSTDQTLAWTLGSALGRVQGSLTFLDGGEASGLVGFAGTAGQPTNQTGRLLFTGFSDSGQTDWVRVTNPGASIFDGTVKLSRGTLDTVLTLTLAPGQSRIVTRASADLLALGSHPLHGAGAASASVATVTWSATGGTVWSLSSADGATLFDMVYILPGKNGWPTLNSSTHRSAFLRGGLATAVGNDAGSSWCALATDDVAGACP